MITITENIGDVTAELTFENITDYAMHLLVTGSISREEFLKFIHTLTMIESIGG